MTNLTDEGLRFLADQIAIKHRERCNCDNAHGICMMMTAIAYDTLQQVRDAAKKEQREACAHMVEDYKIPRFWDSVRDDILGGAAKAIRQMDGGK